MRDKLRELLRPLAPILIILLMLFFTATGWYLRAALHP
jgi:hypothetical protein